MRKRAYRPNFQTCTKFDLVRWMGDYCDFMNTDIKFATNYIFTAIRECDNGNDWMEEYDTVKSAPFTIKQVVDNAKRRFKYTYDINNHKPEDIRFLTYSRTKLLIFKMISVGILDLATKRLDEFGKHKNCKNRKSAHYVFWLRPVTNRFHLNPLWIYRRLWDKSHDPALPSSGVPRMARLVPPSSPSLYDFGVEDTPNNREIFGSDEDIKDLGGAYDPVKVWTDCAKQEPAQTSLFQGSVLPEINEDRRASKKRGLKLLTPTAADYAQYNIEPPKEKRKPSWERVEDLLNSSATFRFCEGEASAIYEGGTLFVAYRCNPGQAMSLLGTLSAWRK